MINYQNCELYRLKRKRDFYNIMRATKKDVALNLNKYLVCINENNRLLEKPNYKLKQLQKRLLYKLYKIEFPKYVFSGIKGKSAYDNAINHINSKYVLKLDMSKFFPNTHREKIYNFFLKCLEMSPDVAKLCTDITTINYKEKEVHIEEGVMNYLRRNHIKTINHLPSGTPTSQLLSYLANLDMFNEIIEYCDRHKLVCSIYVDDLTISTNRIISLIEEKQIKKIVEKYGQKISKKKTIRYNANDYKKITGFVISPNHILVVPNKTRYKIKEKLLSIDNKTLKKSLVGLINYAQVSQKDAYKGLKVNLKE